MSHNGLEWSAEFSSHIRHLQISYVFQYKILHINNLLFCLTVLPGSQYYQLFSSEDILGMVLRVSVLIFIYILLFQFPLLLSIIFVIACTVVSIFFTGNSRALPHVEMS